MKKVMTLVLGCMCVGLAASEVASLENLSDAFDAISYVPGAPKISYLDTITSAGTYLLGYVGNIDKLEAVITAFRYSYQAWNTTSALFGGKTHQQIKEEYLYPPAGAVPNSVLDSMRFFNNQTVATAGIPEVAVTDFHKIRNDADIGPLERDILQSRLDEARQTLQTAQQGRYFFSSDTQQQVGFTGYGNERPYGYALDRGLAESADVPRIAVCYSGGGFRAMIATLGFWQGLSDTGLLPSVAYSANLSGSTWCSMPWSMGASLQQLFDTYEAYAKVRVGLSTISDISAYISPQINIDYIKNKLTAAFLYEQPLSSIRAMYAPLLAQMTLATPDPKGGSSTSWDPQQSSQYTYLWQAIGVLRGPDSRPFPIATALIPFDGSLSQSVSVKQKIQHARNGLWMEFNPEYVGFEYFNKNNQLTGAWIPSFALGRTFTKVTEPKSWWQAFSSSKQLGISSQASVMHTLDYWQGTWGSAYTVSPGDIYRILFGQKVSGDTSMKGVTSEATLSEKLVEIFGSVVTVPLTGKTVDNFKNARLLPAKYNNFALFDDSPITSNTFVAVDAGIDYNLPFPPLLRPGRALDLIIVGDWSQQGMLAAKELLLAEAWAISRGVPFPRIAGSAQYPGVGTRAATLFNEYTQGTGPAILYVPLIDNEFNAPGFSVADCFRKACSTFNFNYVNPRDQSNSFVKQLAQHTYRTLWGIYPQIREVVQAIVDAKNAGQPCVLKKLSSLDSLLESSTLTTSG